MNATITPGQLSILAGCAHKSAAELGDQYPSVFIKEAAGLAEKAAEAMRQLITAEALVADGSWTHESTGLYRNDVVNAGDDIMSIRLFVDFCDDDQPGIYLGDARIPNAKTMHDLRELVRLLGGAQ